MLGNIDKAREYLGGYESFGCVFEGVEREEDVGITPFPTSNRLCSIFP